MTEQLTLDYSFWNRSTIHRDQGYVAPLTCIVDRFCDNFLAHTAFAADKHSNVGRSHLLDYLDDFLHLHGGANDSVLLLETS